MMLGVPWRAPRGYAPAHSRRCVLLLTAFVAGVASAQLSRSEPASVPPGTSTERQQLYFRSIDTVRAQLAAGQRSEALETLWTAPVEYSGWEWGELFLELSPVGVSMNSPSARTPRCVRFSPDASLLLATSSDGTTNIWNSATGTLNRWFAPTLNSRPVMCSQFNSDTSLLAMGIADSTLHIWETKTAALRETLRLPSVAVSLAWNRSSSRLVAGCDDGKVVVIDATQSSIVKVFGGHSAQVLAVAWQSGGDRIASASADGTVRVTSVDGATVRTLSGHANEVTGVSFSPNGTQLCSVANDGARLWDLASGRELRHLGAIDGFNWTASFSHDGSRVLTTSGAGATLWALSEVSPQHVLRPGAARVLSAEFSPDDSRILTCGDDGAVTIWDTASGSKLRVVNWGHIDSAGFGSENLLYTVSNGDVHVWCLDQGAPVLLQGHAERVDGAAFSLDGVNVITVAEDNAARIWDARTGAPRHILSGHTDWVMDAAFSPGTKAATASWDCTAALWDSATGKREHVLAGHTQPLKQIAYSATGDLLLTTSYDHTVRVWDANTGALVATLAHGGDITHAEWTADGQRIFTSSSDHCGQAWDSKTGNLLLAFDAPGIGGESIALSPDNTLVVTASRDGVARVWDMRTGVLVRELKDSDRFVDLVYAIFSPDGRRIATAGGLGASAVWDVGTGKPICEIDAPAATTRLIFTADGNRILSAGGDESRYVQSMGGDESLHIFDAATGRLLNDLRGHTSSVVDAKFDTAGHRLVTSSLDATARVWEAAPWRLDDPRLPKVSGTFSTLEAERKARVLAWKNKRDAETMLAATQAEAKLVPNVSAGMGPTAVPVDETNLTASIRQLGSKSRIETLADFDRVETVRALVSQLRPISEHKILADEQDSRNDDMHVVQCIRGLRFLTRLDFSGETKHQFVGEREEARGQFLELKDQQVNFFGVWMSRDSTYVAPPDAQLEIIQKWRDWLQTIDTFKFPEPAESFDDWYF